MTRQVHIRMKMARGSLKMWRAKVGGIVLVTHGEALLVDAGSSSDQGNASVERRLRVEEPHELTCTGWVRVEAISDCTIMLISIESEASFGLMKALRRIIRLSTFVSSTRTVPPAFRA